MMNDLPSILNTPIIPASANVYWENNVVPFPDRPLLIISTHFESGSPEETQLLKMLQACKLSSEHHNIITLDSTEKISWSKLNDSLHPKAVLLLGILPGQLGISALFRLNEPNHFSNSIFIPTLSIPTLEEKQDMKRQLWNSALKPVFVDNEYGYQ